MRLPCWLNRGSAAFLWPVAGMTSALGISLAGCSGGSDSGEVTASSTQAVVPTISSPAIGPAAEKLWTDFSLAVKPCDEARKSVAVAIGGNEAVAIYSAAKDAERVCNGTWQEVQRLEVPAAAEGEVRTRLEKALETCEQTEFGKKWSLDLLQRAVDRGMRPSDVTEFQEVAQSTEAGMLLCAAGFLEAVESAGGKIEG